ncbi:hypothetical protein MtrunA17_Chr1g0148691 [Medicago truncatula]|uniref:Transmembrane protein n=1 Tax=Medicago truncatula TaxID=3880 RepID=A0A396JJE3_MEDTR|nr:hypothetical protein MtrunA17_Chr1g0148691 [Medicago truncatula]
MSLFSTKSKYHAMTSTTAKKKYGFVGYFMNQFLCIVITRFALSFPHFNLSWMLQTH